MCLGDISSLEYIVKEDVGTKFIWKIPMYLYICINNNLIGITQYAEQLSNIWRQFITL